MKFLHLSLAHSFSLFKYIYSTHTYIYSLSTCMSFSFTLILSCICYTKSDWCVCELKKVYVRAHEIIEDILKKASRYTLLIRF